MSSRTQRLAPKAPGASGEPPAPPPVPDPTAQARQVLEQAKEARASACREEVAQALKRHNCVLDVAVLVTANGNMPQIQIVPRD